MRISRILILLAAVLVGSQLIPYLAVIRPVEQEKYDEYVTKRMDQITTALNESIRYRDRACVYEGPFPYSSETKRRRGNHCDRCDDLHQAGLVTKTLNEFDAGGVKRYDMRFELTDLGRSVYIPGEPGALVQASNGPRFCFGRSTLHKIVEALPPVSLDGNTIVGIKYVVKLEDAHPFLFDPGSKPLRLVVPKPDDRQKDKLPVYPPEITGVIFRPSGDIDIDPSFRYGKFLDR